MRIVLYHFRHDAFYDLVVPLNKIQPGFAGFLGRPSCDHGNGSSLAV